MGSTIDALLSHHSKEEYHKCITISFFGKKKYLCSRCLGFHLVYWPMLLVLILSQVTISNYLIVLLSFIFPGIAYIDWGLTKTKKIKSNNFNRILSGFFLGVGGAIMAFSVLTNPFFIWPYLIAILYFLIARIIYVLNSKQNI